jgi:hypothetical protein
MVVFYSYSPDQCTHMHISLIQHSSIDRMNDCKIVDIQDDFKMNTFKFQTNKPLRQGTAVPLLN